MDFKSAIAVRVIAGLLLAVCLWFWRSLLKRLFKYCWGFLCRQGRRLKSWRRRKDQRIQELEQQLKQCQQKVAAQTAAPEEVSAFYNRPLKAFGVLWEPKEQESTEDDEYIPICPTSGCLTELDHHPVSDSSVLLVTGSKPVVLTDFYCIACGFSWRADRPYSEILEGVRKLAERRVRRSRR